MPPVQTKAVPEGQATPDRILDLQRTVGNRAVQRMLGKESPRETVAAGTVQGVWNPPSLEQRNIRSAQVAAGAPNAYPQLHLRAMNPLDPGVLPFSDISPGPEPESAGAPAAEHREAG